MEKLWEGKLVVLSTNLFSQEVCPKEKIIDAATSERILLIA